jgi:predicted DNA-binding transcriptional regulator YafY
MRELIIGYKDSSGEISERRISGVLPMKNRESIGAFCHLRNAWRTFLVGNIIFAVDAQTGEIIENPWKDLGIASTAGGRETLERNTRKG